MQGSITDGSVADLQITCKNTMKKVFSLPVSVSPLPSQAAVLAYLAAFMPLKK